MTTLHEAEIRNAIGLMKLEDSRNNFGNYKAAIQVLEAALAQQGEPVAWRSAVLDLIDDCPGLTMEQDRWLSRRVKELDFPSAPAAQSCTHDWGFDSEHSDGSSASFTCRLCGITCENNAPAG